MQGRLEHKLERERVIENKIKGNTILEEYYHAIKANKEITTVEEYITKVLAFMIKNRSVYLVTQADIERYLGYMTTCIRNGERKETSSAYRRQIWFALNSFFSFCMKRGYVQKNPCIDIELPKNTDEIKIDSLTENEIKIILDNIRNKESKYKYGTKERDLAIIRIFLETGMRLEALIEINVQDICFEHNTIKVIEKLHKLRNYSIGETTMQIIMKWLEVRDKILDGDFCDALFISYRKKRINRNTIANMIKKYTSELNKNVTPHKFRKTYGTNIYRETKDPYLTQRCLGHVSMDTTKRYLNVNENETNIGSDIMNKLLDKIK